VRIWGAGGSTGAGEEASGGGLGSLGDLDGQGRKNGGPGRICTKCPSKVFARRETQVFLVAAVLVIVVYSSLLAIYISVVWILSYQFVRILLITKILELPLFFPLHLTKKSWGFYALR
jgi:hypothetical protein